MAYKFVVKYLSAGLFWKDRIRVVHIRDASIYDSTENRNIVSSVNRSQVHCLVMVSSNRYRSEMKK